LSNVTGISDHSYLGREGDQLHLLQQVLACKEINGFICTGLRFLVHTYVSSSIYRGKVFLSLLNIAPFGYTEIVIDPLYKPSLYRSLRKEKGPLKIEFFVS
jgi:hypothetical protein